MTPTHRGHWGEQALAPNFCGDWREQTLPPNMLRIACESFCHIHMRYRKNPLFFVHPWSLLDASSRGGVLWCDHLLRRVGQDARMSDAGLLPLDAEGGAE